MDGYLLDTNHMGAAIRPVSKVRDRIQQAIHRGSRFGTCIPVLCELEVAIQPSKRRESLRRGLSRLLQEVRVWPIEEDVIRLFGEIYLDLQRRGRALSHVDIVLAALATRMRVTLLTTDRDFEALPGVQTENWVE